MTLGTAAVGLSGYVFLSVIGHDRFASPVVAALTSTYLLTNIVGPGVFLSVEQEASREVSDRTARGQPLGRTLRRIAVVTAALATVTLAVLAVAARTLFHRVLEQDVGLFAAIALSVVGSAAVFLVRGVAGGRALFGHYAASLLLDGGVRLVGVLVLAVTGSRTPAAYALVLAAGPMVAAAVVGVSLLRRSRETQTCERPPEDSPTPWATVNRSVGLLMLSSLLAYAVSNLSPVMVTAAMPDAPTAAAGFAVGLVMTRIPLLLMGPVQAIMLPRMTKAAARADVAALRHDLRRGLLTVAGFGVLLVAGSALLGRWVIRLLFGTSMDTTGLLTLGLLAVSATLLIAIQFVQPAMVALRRPAGLILGWLAGAACFVAALFLLPVPPLVAAVVAQLVGPAVTLSVHLVRVRRGMHDRAGATASRRAPGSRTDATDQRSRQS